MSTPAQVDPFTVSSLTVLRSLRRTSDAEARTDAARAALFSGALPSQLIAERPLDVLTLPVEVRAHLLSGPSISVIADGNIVIRSNVPIRALMASSTKLYDLLHVKPKVSQIRVHGKIDHESIERLLDIFTTEAVLETNVIKLVGKNFVKDVLLYQACLSLGIHHVHVKPLLKTLRAEVSTHPLSVEEMNTIVNRIPATDPLFKHLANDLCHRRFRKEIPDIVAFEEWLRYDSKMMLQKTMMEIDKEHKQRRQGHEKRQQEQNQKKDETERKNK
jgi:hypothetical protein